MKLISFNDHLSKHRSFIMGVAILAIMMFHQPFVFGDPFTEVFHLYGYWGVELFLFVSGFGLVHSYRRNGLAQYYKNRLLRILPACLFVGLVKTILTKFGLTTNSETNWAINLFSLNLWFIYAILIYYAISPLLIRGIEKFGVWCFLFICGVSAIFEISPIGESPYYLINRLGWAAQRLPVFTLGMLLTIKPLNMNSQPYWLSASFVFMVTALILVLFSHLVRFRWDVPFVYMIVMLGTPAMCKTLCGFADIFAKIHMDKLFVWAGGISLELYLWHEYIYNNLKIYSQTTSKSAVSMLIASFMLSFVLAYLTHLAMMAIQKFLKRIL